MEPVTHFRHALWQVVPYVDGKQDLPLRHVAVLLFVLEKQETSSPDVQATFEIAQPTSARIINDLKGLGLVETYKGSGENSRRDMVAPSAKAKQLLKALNKTLGKLSQ